MTHRKTSGLVASMTLVVSRMSRTGDNWDSQVHWRLEEICLRRPRV